MRYIKSKIAITMGDPSGIGPELCLRVMHCRQILSQCIPIFFGSYSVLDRLAKNLNFPLKNTLYRVKNIEAVPADIHKPVIIDCGDVSFTPASPSVEGGRVSFEAVLKAYDATLKRKTIAMVTSPINKKSWSMAGIKFKGHTDLFKSLSGSEKIYMMLYSSKISVCLVTTHIPVKKISETLSTKKIVDAITITNNMMKICGINKPLICVCGLNPHAGESGLLGKEEINIIIPAIEKAKSYGINVIGPLPPDTAFLPQNIRIIDAYIAMYHDQGLIPFKMLAFDKGVNVTLGLPIIRTSPDHGTAYDIAWKGRAKISSMIEAIRLALRLAKNKEDLTMV